MTTTGVKTIVLLSPYTENTTLSPPRIPQPKTNTIPKDKTHTTTRPQNRCAHRRALPPKATTWPSNRNDHCTRTCKRQPSPTPGQPRTTQQPMLHKPSDRHSPLSRPTSNKIQKKQKPYKFSNQTTSQYCNTQLHAPCKFYN
jgi:hypothetical protein